MTDALFLDHHSADNIVRELQAFCASINPGISCSSCPADESLKDKCSQVTHDNLSTLFIEIYEHFVEEEVFMKSAGLCETAEYACEEHKRQHAEIVEEMRQLIQRASELTNAELIKILNVQIIDKLKRHLESIDFEFHAYQQEWHGNA